MNIKKLKEQNLIKYFYCPWSLCPAIVSASPSAFASSQFWLHFEAQVQYLGTFSIIHCPRKPKALSCSSFAACTKLLRSFSSIYYHRLSERCIYLYTWALLLCTSLRLYRKMTLTEVRKVMGSEKQKWKRNNWELEFHSLNYCVHKIIYTKSYLHYFSNNRLWGW